MVRTLSSELIRQESPSLQHPVPKYGLKFGVAKPLSQPWQDFLKFNQEYRIAFAMRDENWTGDHIIREVKKREEKILFMWFVLDDGTYYMWGYFKLWGTILLPSQVVRPELGDMRWELTQAPSMVLFEKKVIKSVNSVY